jgi:hypothetical protein
LAVAHQQLAVADHRRHVPRAGGIHQVGERVVAR